MDFSFNTYKRIIEQLLINDYSIVNYKSYQHYPKAAILRHDIDFSLEANYEFSIFEDSLGVKSTYFVLLSTGFYNPMLKENRLKLQDMLKRGHSIGLHFDTAAYDDWMPHVLREKTILEDILDCKVDLLSFHRPAPYILENDIHFPGLTNAYSKEFFTEFKYCSDSRFFWRDNPFDIINSNKYNRVHILTHPFSWHNKDIPARETYIKLINTAAWERYVYLTQNIRNPEEFLLPSEAEKLWGVKGE